LIYDKLGPCGILDGKKVLELGSGTGLGGLIAANYAEYVTMTDYQDTIMKLLSMNINIEVKKAKCTYAMLDWNKIE
jgi:predicted nicotinamide N-methyase